VPGSAFLTTHDEARALVELTAALADGGRARAARIPTVRDESSISSTAHRVLASGGGNSAILSRVQMPPVPPNVSYSNSAQTKVWAVFVSSLQAGLTCTHYQQLERGYWKPGSPANPSSKLLARVAQVLGLEISDLLPSVAALEWDD
jgi:hypothetical protein